MPVDLSTIPQKLAMGLEAVMLDHAEKTNRRNRQDVATFRDFLLTDKNNQPLPKAPEKPEGEDENMMVFGDVQITNTNETPTTTTTVGSPVRSRLGTLGKLAIAGGLLASGAGIGAAVPFILSALKPSPEPQVVQPAPKPGVDTDTRYRIDLE